MGAERTLHQQVPWHTFQRLSELEGHACGCLADLAWPVAWPLSHKACSITQARRSMEFAPAPRKTGGCPDVTQPTQQPLTNPPANEWEAGAASAGDEVGGRPAGPSPQPRGGERHTRDLGSNSSSASSATWLNSSSASLSVSMVITTPT